MGLGYLDYLSKSESKWVNLFSVYIKNAMDTIVFSEVLISGSNTSKCKIKQGLHLWYFSKY